MFRTQRFVLLAIAATLVACAQSKAPVVPASARPTAASGAAATDPVTSDPAAIDAAFPAAIEEVGIASGESYMVGIVYVAQGAGPHPLVILLHGYPGDERNADLAQSLRRAGSDVLLFHYRGAWGSQGKFSFSNALEDVGSALAEARTASFAKRFRSDPSRVVLVGHSMGGLLAITAASEDPGVRCVASLAGANLGLLGRAAANPERRAEFEKALGGWSGPIRGASGKKLVAELMKNADRFDTTRRGAALATRPVLLVAGSRDSVTPAPVHHDPLVAAFTAAGAKHTRSVVLDADHAFSDKRIALAHAVVEWIGTECR
jgi:pimeloyl-ACP methyl ester carboxylesterase